MSFDASRFSFHPWHDYLGVMMQQGRVQLDADWNEWVAELNRRMQAGTLDTIGRAVVPRITPKGFEILEAGDNLTIGVGRMYVDGLLAENHGVEPVAWDAGLAEEVGTKPVPFFDQPYLPFNEKDETSPAKSFNRPVLKGGPYLVFLDVWQREVTCLQDMELVEKAVGVETTGRLQTVWQVKVLAADDGFTCSSADQDLPKWEELIQPSGARLSCTTGAETGEENPCLLQPSAQYTGLENQLYRVEIHNGGSQGTTSQKSTASFKWSRDNGTVAAQVLAIHNGNRLVVDSLGRDDVLGFHAGDWIEILDDWHELHNIPGRLHRIQPDSGIDQATRSITLQTPLPADLFPVDKDSLTLPGRHTRIRRWDQTGAVRRTNGTIYHDLNTSGVSSGIPVPAVGTQLFLENGILIDFTREGKGQFRVGDHWVFAARATDGTIEELMQAPPRGIHHHYARLATATFPGTPSSCREFWPPEITGESCDCTVCVDPKGHNSGAATIQQAIDIIRERGGGTVCLDVGSYLLRAPLDIQNGRSLRLRGQGWRTVLKTMDAGKAINIVRGIGIDIENLSVQGITGLRGTAAMISVKDCVGLHFTGLTLAATASGGTAVAIGLSGLLLNASFADSIFVAGQGISALLEKGSYLLTAELRITNNIFLCEQDGVSLRGACLHYGQTRLADNLLLNCAKSGFALTGGALSQAAIAIAENVFHLVGTGIIGGIDGLRVERNEILAMAGKTKNDGILLQRDAGLLSSLALEAIRISDNTLQFQRGHAVAIEHRLVSATVNGNDIEKVAGSALVMGPGSSAEYLRLEGNRFTSVGTGFTSREESFCGIRLMAVKRSDIAGNLFSDIALRADTSPFLASVLVMACREVRLAGNRFFNIGPVEFMGRSAAIVVAPGFADALLSDNSMTREVQTMGDKPSDWQALLVYGDPNGGKEHAPMVFDHMPDMVCLMMEKGGHIYLSDAQILMGDDLARIGVRGNVIRNHFSNIPCVQILIVESCLFNDNDIEIVPSSGSNQIAGEISSRHASVANNRFVAGKEISFRLQVADKDKFSVMGNLRTGAIEVNGISDTSLPPPWNALNVRI